MVDKACAGQRIAEDRDVDAETAMLKVGDDITAQYEE